MDGICVVMCNPLPKSVHGNTGRENFQRFFEMFQGKGQVNCEINLISFLVPYVTGDISKSGISLGVF